MKLRELMSCTLLDAISNMDIVKFQPYADDEGNVQKVLVEYAPAKGTSTLRHTPGLKSAPNGGTMYD